MELPIRLPRTLPVSHHKLEIDELGVYYEAPAIARLPFNAAAIMRDLRPDDWEVTQGIQNLVNDVG